MAAFVDGVSRLALAALGVFAMATASFACAVCGFGDSSRSAFLSATAILTIVPLVAIGGIFYFVYKRATAGALQQEVVHGHVDDPSAQRSSDLDRN